MPVTRQNFEELGLPVGPYTHAVKAGSLLYTSGFTAFGTPAQPADAKTQTLAVLDQLELVAERSGTSMKELVKVTIFAISPEDIPGIRDALAARYQDDVPASSLVLVAGLFAPDLKVEIEAVFAL
ncbi:RidA family protein [Roseibium denhamense]|nr:RidA family protein [Roseibium denhamense]